MNKRTRYSPEVREWAVRSVFKQESAHKSQWAAIQSVACKIGCSADTSRKWVRQTERDTGRPDRMNTSDRERLEELERENRELKRANDIRRTASVYFAQAELDRRRK